MISLINKKCQTNKQDLLIMKYPNARSIKMFLNRLSPTIKGFKFGKGNLFSDFQAGSKLTLQIQKGLKAK